MEPVKHSGVINMMGFVADRTTSLARENTVVGERIEADGMTIIPISKLSVSFAGGGADLVDAKKKKKSVPAGGGAKVDLQPLSVLVIKNGAIEIVNIKTEKTVGAEIASTIVDSVKKLMNKNENK